MLWGVHTGNFIHDFAAGCEIDYEKNKQKHNLCFRDLLRVARKILDVEKTLQSTIQILGSQQEVNEEVAHLKNWIEQFKKAISPQHIKQTVVNTPMTIDEALLMTELEALRKLSNAVEQLNKSEIKDEPIHLQSITALCKELCGHLDGLQKQKITTHDFLKSTAASVEKAAPVLHKSRHWPIIGNIVLGIFTLGIVHAIKFYRTGTWSLFNDPKPPDENRGKGVMGG